MILQNLQTDLRSGISDKPRKNGSEGHVVGKFFGVARGGRLLVLAFEKALGFCLHISVLTFPWHVMAKYRKSNQEPLFWGMILKSQIVSTWVNR